MGIRHKYDNKQLVGEKMMEVLSINNLTKGMGISS